MLSEKILKLKGINEVNIFMANPNATLFESDVFINGLKNVWRNGGRITFFTHSTFTENLNHFCESHNFDGRVNRIKIKVSIYKIFSEKCLGFLSDGFITYGTSANTILFGGKTDKSTTCFDPTTTKLLKDILQDVRHEIMVDIIKSDIPKTK